MHFPYPFNRGSPSNNSIDITIYAISERFRLFRFKNITQQNKDTADTKKQGRSCGCLRKAPFAVPDAKVKVVYLTGCDSFDLNGKLKKVTVPCLQCSGNPVLKTMCSIRVL